MSQSEILAKLTLAQQLVNEAIVMMSGVAAYPGDPKPTEPATEAPPCYSACRNFIDRAVLDGKMKMSDYGIEGIQTGNAPGYGAKPARMTQANQDKLESDVRGLLASEYGQAYLEDEANAAQIDRRYCFAFRGYWLSAKSSNPDDGYLVHVNNPGNLP